MEQRTEEWFAARLGKVTASKVADVMARTKSGYGAARKNYMMELLCQRLTGTREEGFTTAAMQRGNDLEPIARSAYEADTGLMVFETGLCDHPIIEGFAASPDGIVGDNGLLEIKCPNTATHIAFMETLIPDKKYQWQMLAQMACSGRDWCDFVSFDDRLPEPLQYVKVRFLRDEHKIKLMEEEVESFLFELAEKVQQMQERIAA